MYCDHDKIPIFKFRFSYISLFSIGFAFHVYLCSTVGWASLERWASLELFRRKWFSWRCHWEMLLFIAWTVSNFICVKCYAIPSVVIPINNFMTWFIVTLLSIVETGIHRNGYRGVEIRTYNHKSFPDLHLNWRLRSCLCVSSVKYLGS